MILIERDWIRGCDPEDNKSYLYSIELEHTVADEDYPYVIKFNRRGYDAPIESLHLIVDRCDIETIYKNPEIYWNYYNHLYHHDKPMTVYCRFDRDGGLHHTVNLSYAPSAGAIFNKVIRKFDADDAARFGYPQFDSVTDVYGDEPIYEISVWLPQGESFECSLSESVIEIIREYNGEGE